MFRILGFVENPRPNFGTVDRVRLTFPSCFCVGDVADKFVQLGPGIKSGDPNPGLTIHPGRLTHEVSLQTVIPRL